MEETITEVSEDILIVLGSRGESKKYLPGQKYSCFTSQVTGSAVNYFSLIFHHNFRSVNTDTS